MVQIDDDLQIARWRGRGLVHDRDLFLLGTALERVTEAEHPGRDDGTARGTAEAVDWSLERLLGGVGFARLLGRCVVLVDRFGAITLVPLEIVHTSTVRPIAVIAGRGPVGCGP